jgi:hypothetical protein
MVTNSCSVAVAANLTAKDRRGLRESLRELLLVINVRRRQCTLQRHETGVSRPSRSDRLVVFTKYARVNPMTSETKTNFPPAWLSS